MIILQNILQPGGMREKAMCFHENGNSIFYDGYFNIFSLKKWQNYTNLKNIDLHLQARGPFTVTVFSEEGAMYAVTEGIAEDKHTDTGEKYVIPLVRAGSVVHTEGLCKHPAILWIAWTPLSADSELVKAAWATEDEPLQSVRLAVNVCTYRREEYVRGLIEKILSTDFFSESSREFCRQPEIFISDNGRTLCNTGIFADRRVHLYANSNVGGSGGFTRGLIEIRDINRREAAGFTHVIFADDDAVPEEDAFGRTWAFLSFVKEEYRGACVAGAVLDSRIPWMQNEAGARYDHGVSIPLGKRLDLRERKNVIDNEQICKADYAGWWYACYPMKTIDRIGLPLPLFIHFDDIEYGLRSGEEFMYLNGICTWHGSFDERYSHANTYYSLRNRFITNALRDPGSGRHREAVLCRNEILFGLLRYQYSSAELVLAAVEDFCRGPEYLKRLDPEKNHDRIREMADHFLPLDELGRSPEERLRLKKYASAVRNGFHPDVHIDMGTYRRTVNGWLLPSVRSRKICCYSVYRTDMRELYRKKEAALIDVYSDKGVLVKKSYRKALRCMYAMGKVSILFLWKYKKAAEAFRREEIVLESEMFWKSEMLKRDN